MTDDDLKKKFKSNSRHSGLGSDKVEEMIEAIYKLDQNDNTERLASLFTLTPGW